MVRVDYQRGGPEEVISDEPIVSVWILNKITFGMERKIGGRNT